MEEKKKDSGFVIKDKRFSGDSEESRPEEEKPKAAEDKQESADKSQPPPEPEFDFPVNFSNFILSLSTSALYHFGDFPETEGAKPQKNLTAVKQTIDILDMLHEKTKGNLDANEANLIQGVIYELKMRYVKEKA